MELSTKLLIGAAVVGGGWFLWKKLDLGDKLNPLSDKNIAYTSANSLVQSLTGDPKATVSNVVAPLASDNWDANALPGQPGYIDPNAPLPQANFTGFLKSVFHLNGLADVGEVYALGDMEEWA